MSDQLQVYEDYLDGSVPERVRGAQRAMLIHLSMGCELWKAAAKAVGVDPDQEENNLPVQERCLRIAMRWLDDPGIEKATDQIQRVATATMRLLRMQAVMVMGRSMMSENEQIRTRAATEVLKATDHLKPMDGSIPLKGDPADEVPAAAPTAQGKALKIGSEATRQRLRMLTKKRMEGTKAAPSGD